MNEEIANEILEHHGIKGMHWGIRNKSRNKVSRSRTRTVFGKAPAKLSDQELTRRVERMQTEKKYNELNRRDFSAGAKISSDILGHVGKTVAKTVLTGAAILVVKHAIQKKFGEDAAKIVTKRGK